MTLHVSGETTFMLHLFVANTTSQLRRRPCAPRPGGGPGPGRGGPGPGRGGPGPGRRGPGPGRRGLGPSRGGFGPGPGLWRVAGKVLTQTILMLKGLVTYIAFGTCMLFHVMSKDVGMLKITSAD